MRERLGDLDLEVKPDTFDPLEREELAPKVKNIPELTYTIEVNGVPFEIDTGHFNIDETDLPGEACRIGQLLCYYADFLAAAKTFLFNSEETVKAIFSASYVDKKRNWPEKERATEEYVKNLVAVEPTYRQAVNTENQAKSVTIRAEALWRAIQKKADLINMLGYSKSAELKKGY